MSARLILLAPTTWSINQAGSNPTSLKYFRMENPFGSGFRSIHPIKHGNFMRSCLVSERP
ncbi:MAG: hypothetical protein ACTSRT_16805 [Promethearchaeota archaeon]